MEVVYVVLGMIAGTLSGLLGVGGGWLVVPTLNLLGMDMTVAVGTSLLQMVGGSLIGLISHYRFGHFNGKIALLFALPGMIGSHGGKEIGLWLSQNGVAEDILSSLYLVLLGTVMILIWFRRRQPKDQKKSSPFRNLGPAIQIHDQIIPLYIPILSGFVIGMIAAILGIGGGLFLVPLAVYGLGIPIHIAVGSTILSIFLGSTYSGISYSIAGKTDLTVAFFLLLGASFGGWLGAASSKIIRSQTIENVYLALVVSTILAISFKLLAFEHLAYSLMAASGIGFIIFLGTSWARAFLRKTRN